MISKFILQSYMPTKLVDKIRDTETLKSHEEHVETFPHGCDAVMS